MGPLSIAYYIADCLADVILRDERSLRRAEIARAYVEIGLQSLLDRATRFRITRVSLLGMTLRYFDPSAALFTFEDCFVRQVYNFRASSPQPFIIDGGSNVGMSIAFFKALYPESRILGFEPDPQTFYLLSDNVTSNGWHGVTLRNRALNDTPGEVDFFVDPHQPGSVAMSMEGERGERSVRPVQADRLPDQFDEPVDLLKLDIEGAEGRVIADLARSGKLRLVRQMIVEYHHHLDPNQNALARTLGVLEDAGFAYQIRAQTALPTACREFQPILIYARRSCDQGESSARGR